MMHKTVKIIVVDDHQMFIDGIKAMFSVEKEFELIAEATNAKELFNILNTTLPDVILMDIGIPEMNGVEITEALTKKYPDVKIIALSMYDDYSHVVKIVKAGAKGYVLKTSSTEELLLAVTSVFNGNPYFTKQITDIMFKESIQPSPLTTLTKRELQIIALIVKSLTNKEIADKLHLSELTVNTHRKNVMQKLGVKNTAGLVKFAIENNLA